MPAAYCESRRAFLISDCKRNLTPDDMAAEVRSASMPKTSDAAVYIRGSRLRIRLIPARHGIVAPSGSIAGLYARIDSTRGVWEAPAGTGAAIVGPLNGRVPLSDGENGTLNSLGSELPARAARRWSVWARGARTLAGADGSDQYKYISVRRLALSMRVLGAGRSGRFSSRTMSRCGRRSGSASGRSCTRCFARARSRAAPSGRLTSSSAAATR